MVLPFFVGYLLPFRKRLNDLIYIVKHKINDMVNIDKILSRLKIKAGLKHDREIAALFGLSAQDFGNRKKRGSLLPLLLDWAINENVDLHYFIVGGESSATCGLTDEDPQVARLLEGAKRVLKSGNSIAFDALERNINYFDHAVAAEERLRSTEAKMEAMSKKMAEIEARLLAQDSPEKKEKVA